MNSPHRIVAIIQARMASSRLPGKVLMDIHGWPMLVWVVVRAKQAQTIDEVVVATSTDSADDPIASACQRWEIPVFRGAHFDVLDRYFQAAKTFSADVIVRLTADCPLIDPGVIDATVRAFLNKGVDFAANRLPPPWKRTYPIGLDVEVCTFAALEKAWQEAKETFEREHVMPYLYDEEGRFNFFIVNHKPDYGSHRWTVDTKEDLDFVRKVIKHLESRKNFSWHEVLALLEEKPALAQINKAVKAKQTQDVDDKLQ